MKYWLKKVDLMSIAVFIILMGIIALLYFPTFERKFVYIKKYENLVTKYSDEYEIDKNLCFAVIKAESGFKKDAVSSAGAVGLMQIKHATAIYIAEILGETIDLENLKDPEINIKYGVYYIKYLFKKYPFEKEVLCAYNAGEGNVNEWLKDKKYSEDGLTIKTIPFGETKNYLQKVLKFKQKYKKLY